MSDLDEIRARSSSIIEDRRYWDAKYNRTDEEQALVDEARAYFNMLRGTEECEC